MDRPEQGSAGLTRREVLLGGGAAAVIALGAAAWVDHSTIADRFDRLLARFQHGPVPPHTGATLVDRAFHSRVLGQAVNYSLALPPDVAVGTPLPVAFCLPGRGATARSVTEGMYFEDFLGQAVCSGAVPFALAAVDGGQSYWHRRASGEDRMAMLVREFIPLCERTYKLGSSRGRRAAMGWSMGGYGVLLAAETYPQLFTAVVATSPAVWPTYQDMMNGPRDAFDSAADFAAHDVIGGVARLASTPALIECGTADPFYPFVRQLCARLPDSASYRFSFGGHSPAFWRTIALQELRFVSRRFRAAAQAQ
jgi:enterochelin esterase-like enzyme